MQTCFLLQTEEEFLAELTQGAEDDPVDGDDPEDESEESEEEDVEEQERESSPNGGRKTQVTRFSGERRRDVETAVYALQQEGETKARLALCSRCCAEVADQSGYIHNM